MFYALIFLAFIGILGIILSIVLEKERKPKYNYQTQLNFLNDSLYVKKVINSCITVKQLYVSDNLITNIKNKYKNKVEKDLYWKVINELNKIWFDRDNEF